MKQKKQNQGRKKKITFLGMTNTLRVERHVSCSCKRGPFFTSRTQQRMLRNKGDCWKSGTAWRGLQPRFQRFAVILVQTITLIDFLPPPQNSQDRLNCQATDASLFSKLRVKGSLSCIATTAREQKCSNNMSACVHVCVHEYVGAFFVGLMRILVTTSKSTKISHVKFFIQ